MGLPKEIYRLELHWKKVVEERFTKIKLDGAYFYGSVLKISAKIKSNDNIILDLTNQFSIFVPSFYLSRLNWRNVNYSEDRVFLENCYLEVKKVNAIPKLKDTDFFIINCEKHEEYIHPNYLTYETYLANKNKEVYKY